MGISCYLCTTEKKSVITKETHNVSSNVENVKAPNRQIMTNLPVITPAARLSPRNGSNKNSNMILPEKEEIDWQRVNPEAGSVGND